MPKISVIVPVYNVESYLEQCVESVLSQTCSDFELLLVNDASTDGSLALAKSFERDPRVRVVDKPHGGLGDTRNYGVRESGGEYLVFLDSDDWVEPGLLEALCQAAEEQQPDLVLYNFIRENMEDGESRVCSLPLQYPAEGEEVNRLLFAQMIGPDAADTPWRSVEMLGCAWRRMYRRDWFCSRQFQFFNEQELMLEDLPANIIAHYFAEHVIVLEGAYYHYRYNPNSLSTRYRPGKMEMLLKCFCLVEEFLADHGLEEQYHERHLAWLLRNAAHGALVNCFVPHAGASFRARYREVRSILTQEKVQEAARSGYFSNGTRADRMIGKIVRSGNTLLAYIFYRNYFRILSRNSKKK